jgi:sigma-E factor negative regulatory protein RseB
MLLHLRRRLPVVMPSVGPSLVPSLALLVALCSPLLLQPARAGGDEQVDARAWLARIHSAANRGNYQGTMVVTAGGAVSSSKVWHFRVGDQSYERLEAMDGRQQRVYRHNDTVQTVWPQSRVAVVERREALSMTSTTPQAVEPRALEQYTLKSEGVARVAGRDAQVFLLDPRDRLRFAQRLWADQASGLMLRADVIAPGREGTVLESAAFSQVEIGVKPQPELVTQALKKLDGYRVVRPQQQSTQLKAEGWTLAAVVPGFKLAGCVKRQLEAAAQDERAAETVLQTVFFDGLTHVSLFIEPFIAQRHRGEGQGQIGATGTLMQRSGEFWITVMGDVPLATLKQFADALQRRR